MPFLYDGQSETVQATARAALAAVQASIASLLTAPGDAALALAQDLPVLAAAAPDDQAGYAAALAALLADYVAAIVADAALPASPAPVAVAALFAYYKQWYNTPSGAATPAQFAQNWMLTGIVLPMN